MALNLEDYFRTVYEDKLLVKMPEREDEYLTPATQLLEKRREMSEVEQALAAQKEEFQMKMESLQQRREELERKEEQLKESLLKFNKFLKENDLKRSRAVKKACDAREMARQKDRDMERLGEEIAVLEAKKERLQRKVEKNAIFWKYLEKVSKKSEKLQEIREMIGRFDTLISTREQLLRKASDNQEKLESQRLELHHFTEDKSTQVLYYNNELAVLQGCLDQACSKAVKWESKWNHIQNTAAKKTLLLGQIKMASLNLLQLVNKQAGEQEAEIPIEDTDGQLDRIQMFILDQTDILRDLKRMDANPTSNTQSNNQ
ncbi:coiled-coil domain-containing protein 42 homolog [Acipenser ruthenus]|uniref:coiled-coil domain-containing protein 42 homolog n=1 Tax=Acipenser ruthenus TaxID=7906 RepID=UPI00145BF785|nr:coiled-coil domain-containing protein 42 homolog [Acipenser ruthenus]